MFVRLGHFHNGCLLTTIACTRLPWFFIFLGEKTNPLWGYCLNKEGIIVLVLWSSEAIIVKKAYYVYMYYVGNIIMASSLAAVMQLIKPRLA